MGERLRRRNKDGKNLRITEMNERLREAFRVAEVEGQGHSVVRAARLIKEAVQEYVTQRFVMAGKKCTALDCITYEGNMELGLETWSLDRFGSSNGRVIVQELPLSTWYHNRANILEGTMDIDPLSEGWIIHKA